MSIQTSRPRPRRSARGFTLAEFIIAAGIGSSVVVFVSYLTIFAARSQAVLLPQMSRQQAAGRVMQAITEELRNARFSTISITDGGSAVLADGDRIDFESQAYPAGQTSSIRFLNGTVAFYPDASDSGSLHLLGRGFENVTFALDNNMVEIAVVFKYRKHKGYNASEQERLNGTFATRIYPRNG